MSAQISNISLYIPHVFPNYTKEDVQQVFENQKIGKVSHVDFVSKMGKDGKPYNAAYIHFEFWCDTIANRNLQARICDPTKEARIVYDEPWHWIVLENKARKYATGERKPRIDLGTTAKTVAAKSEWQTFPVVQPIASVPAPDFAAALDFAASIELAAALDFAAALDKELPEDEEDAEFKQLIDEMDECVASMEEEDQHLTSVDARYIQSLEQENAYFRNEMQMANIRMMQLNNSLYNEQAKSNALAEAIRMVSLKN